MLNGIFGEDDLEPIELCQSQCLNREMAWVVDLLVKPEITGSGVSHKFRIAR